MTAALTGLGAGAAHALSGPDHLLGGAPHAAGRPSGAWRVGAAWGAGHAAGTAAACAAFLAVASTIHLPGLERWAERGAGLALVVMGLLGLASLRRAAPAPGRAQAPPGGLVAAGGIGLVHGLLGAPALVVLLAGAAASPGDRTLFLAGFSGGGIAAMALLTEGVARAARLPRLAAVLPAIPRVASAASVLVGAAWVAVG